MARVILGTGSPPGRVPTPRDHRLLSLLCSVGDVPVPEAFCWATGNTARIQRLDCGLIEPGRAADLVFLDRPQHSAGKDVLDALRLGDLPGIGMVIIDGVVRGGRSRNTPPAERVPNML